MVNNIDVKLKEHSVIEIQKDKILKLTKYEKLKYIDNLVIEYPKMTKILSAIEECKNSTFYSKQPECLSLTGPPRCGKTTIIETFIKKYPDNLTEEGTVKPILYCEVPCPATINGLVSTLLLALGDPFYNRKSTIIDKTFRLEKLLKKCRVQLIILDEVQHLIDSNRKKLIHDSSDWFKNLIAKTKIPVVFVGLEYSLQVFEENKQLGSRVLNRFSIKPFDFSDKTFKIILHFFDQALPLIDPSDLSKDNIWQQIYIATHGYLGYVKVLLKEATKIAIEENYNKLTLPILAKAYENKLKHIFDINPFLPGFNLNKAINQIQYL